MTGIRRIVLRARSQHIGDYSVRLSGSRTLIPKPLSRRERGDSIRRLVSSNQQWPAGHGVDPLSAYGGRGSGVEIVCTKCKAPLRLIALIKSEATAKKILDAMHLPSEVPKLHPARPPPGSPGVEGGEKQAGESWLN